MADNVQITEGAGKTIHGDEYTHATFGAGTTQLVKVAIGAPGTGVDLIAGAGAATTGTPRVTQATDDIVPTVVAAGLVTVSTDVTRPADTTAYAANDCISDSTSAPTSGGFTLTGAARTTAKSGLMTDVVITSSNPAGGLSGELWIFDTSVTNINDNSAFSISDAEVKTLVSVVPFVTVADTNNSQAVVQVNAGFTTTGTANLRFLLKAKAAYTPISAEVFTVRAKCWQLN